jgi:SAM-dependent methyltransferase
MVNDVDFGRRSADYAAYRPGFPDSFYERLGALAKIDGSRVLDLGTGPGVVALEFAKRGAVVMGVDVAENQIGFAVKCADELDLAQRCRFLVRNAEDTQLEPCSFDWVTAGQCWHWFNGPAALAEAKRVLRPGGLLVIARFAYATARSEIAHLTDELILKHNPTWTFAFEAAMNPRQGEELIEGGMDLVEEFNYYHPQTFTHEGWRGRMRTCNGVGSRITDPQGVAVFDRELAEMLREHGFSDPMTIEHRVWAVVARKKG